MVVLEAAFAGHDALLLDGDLTPDDGYLTCQLFYGVPARRKRDPLRSLLRLATERARRVNDCAQFCERDVGGVYRTARKCPEAAVRVQEELFGRVHR